jgi:hypothetical protein
MEKVGAIKVGMATRAYGNHPPTTESEIHYQENVNHEWSSTESDSEN